MKPLSNQVLFKPFQKMEKIGSLFLASSAQEDQSKGIVVAAGPGKLAKDAGALVAMTVAVGDEILFVPERVVATTFNGEKHFLVSEDDILAVM